MLRLLGRPIACLQALIVLCALSTAAVAAPDEVEISTNEVAKHNVLENDELPDETKVTDVSKGLNGKAEIHTKVKAIIVYTPNPEFIGVEKLTYTAEAPNGTETKDTLTITVRGVVEGLSAEQLANAGIVLFQALIYALVLEIGIHLIFSYRWFIYYAEGRGVKVPVMVILALILVNSFDFDLIQRLTAIFTVPTPQSNWISVFLTGLIIAGGSSTVYAVYRGLGLRPPASEREGSEFRRTDFGRVKFKVNRGPHDAPVVWDDLEVFVDGKLHGTIPKDRSEFPLRRISSLPVPLTARRFRVAVSSDFSGQRHWERELSISRLESVVLVFDLTKPPPQDVPPKPEEDT